MGEISEALRRAREGTHANRVVSAGEPTSGEPRAAATRSVLIPAEEDASDRARLVLTRPASPAAESYRQSAIQLSRVLLARPLRSVLVASAGVGEGKTTTACNLALAFASLFGTRRTALLELDLRRPTAAAALAVTPPAGIEAALDGSATLAGVRCTTQLATLDLFLARKASRAPLPLIASSRMTSILKELERSYDTVIVDSPPILPVPDAALIAACVGGVLLVARAGVSRRAAVEEATEKVGRESVIGFFLNDRREPRHRSYAEYYSYGPTEDVQEATVDGAARQ